MANASKDVLSELEAVINQVGADLPKVKGKKMFGCHALFAEGNVFGLVWKEGRIGVRLPEEKIFSRLISEEGSAPWKAGKMTMSHWVLVPKTMHSDAKKLSSWVRTAHELALKTAKKPAKKPSKKKR